ncbi:hypothetical protein L873DRAFT_1838616 [Choiromyces venosus 120613-1]|uniref:MFS general substrate transporter n=1 Tax=Choiromyces venosus 120613-1 TaxID=1336337 RepID=A0A3N4J5U4_9PEZI|nr:hypothetical protein L873DRAFT_1838616 [Choiromyces venosus 120613-1]
MTGVGHIIREPGWGDHVIVVLVAWYQKPNLQYLYSCLVPAAMDVEWTSGFGGSIMNGLQAVETWDTYFNKPHGAIPGIMNSMYSLGALSMMPIVPWVNDNSQLIGELAYRKERAILAPVFSVSWYISGIIAAGVTLGTFQIQSDWAWRIPSVLQIVPSAFQLIFICDPNNEFVKAEYAEMIATIQMDLEQKSRAWSELISTTANIKRYALVAFIGTFSQWSGNGLVSYYLARVFETVNLGLNCWNLVTGFTASYLVGITPRPVMYLTSVTGMFITPACWTGASASYAETKSSGAAGAMIFLYYPFYNGAPLTYTYTIELFPFSMRAKVANIGWKYIVYTVWLAAEGVVICFTFPETKGKTLEDLAFIFEGDEKRAEQSKRSNMQMVVIEVVDVAKGGKDMN